MHGEPLEVHEYRPKESLQQSIPSGRAIREPTIEEDGGDTSFSEQSEEIGPEFALEVHIEIRL
jgi:hypothetical protein